MKPDETLANTGINKAASWGPRTMELFPLKSVQSKRRSPGRSPQGVKLNVWCSMVNRCSRSCSTNRLVHLVVSWLVLFWVWLFFGRVIWIWIVIFFKAKRLGSPSFHDCSYYAGRCSTAIRVVEDGCSGTEPLQSSLPTGGVLHLLQTEAASEIREMCYLTNHARFAVPPYCNYIQPFSLKDNKVQRLNIFPAQKTWPGSQQPKWASTYYRWKEEWKPSSRLDNGQEEQVRMDWLYPVVVCILEISITPAHLGVCQVGLS